MKLLAQKAQAAVYALRRCQFSPSAFTEETRLVEIDQRATVEHALIAGLLRQLDHVFDVIFPRGVDFLFGVPDTRRFVELCCRDAGTMHDHTEVDLLFLRAGEVGVEALMQASSYLASGAGVAKGPVVDPRPGGELDFLLHRLLIHFRTVFQG